MDVGVEKLQRTLTMGMLGQVSQMNFLNCGDGSRLNVVITGTVIQVIVHYITVRALTNKNSISIYIYL